MTDKELDEIEARCRAATEGPWSAEHEVDDAGFEQRELWIVMRGQPTAYRFDRAEDAEFCAHARTDVPALVAEVRRLREMEACGGCGALRRDHWACPAANCPCAAFVEVKP